MFPNLRAEMARNGVTNADLAEAAGCDASTMSTKMNNPRRLKFEEAKRIKEKLFPELTIDYLFQYAWETKKTS